MALIRLDLSLFYLSLWAKWLDNYDKTRQSFPVLYNTIAYSYHMTLVLDEYKIFLVSCKMLVGGGRHCQRIQ